MTRNPSGLMEHVCYYIADFVYNNADGKRVVEDVKGGMTPLAELKGKWFKAQYGFAILYTQ